MQRFRVAGVPLYGPSLVEASAGTGKTHAIATLYVRLLLERGLAAEQILVVTFTEAATMELRARVRRRLREVLEAFEHPERQAPDSDVADIARRSTDTLRDRSRLRLALQHADEASIFTIHGFCQRVLSEHAFDSGVPFDAELLTDVQRLTDEVVQDFWAAELTDAPAVLMRVVQQAHLDPARCRELAHAALRSPYARLIPPAREGLPPLDAGPFRAALARAAEVWDEGRVAAKLGRHPTLDRRSYSTRSLGRWCDAVSALLSAPPPELPALPQSFERFTTERLRSACRSGPPPADPFFAAADEVVEAVAAFDEAAAAQVVELKRRLVLYTHRELRRRKDAAALLSFDDLLVRLHEAVSGPSTTLARAVRQRYPAALIDEFQDTDPVQFGIFERIYGAEHGEEAAALMLIGDPKQAIYAFRGADVFAYVRAAEATPPERRFTMGTSYRTDPRLLGAVNALFAGRTRPFVLPSIGYPEVSPKPGAGERLDDPDGDGGALQLLFLRRPARQSRLSKAWAAPHVAVLVAGDIAALLQRGARIDGRPVTPADVAVLTRTNRQAFEVQAALSGLRIPSVVLGDMSVFDDACPEARELQRVLAAALEPTSTMALRAALTTELLGVDAQALSAMERDTGAWESWVERFRVYHDTWSRSGFIQMFRALAEQAALQERLLALADGERRVTNLLHLAELLHTASTTEHLGPAGLLHWLEVQRQNARRRTEVTQIRLESDAEAVQIVTMHGSKGLEYPIVYCPYCWDGTLLRPNDEVVEMHDPDAGDAPTLDLERSTRSQSIAEKERFAESLRLLYVALTRARHRCTVVWGAFHSFETSALGYALHPPPLLQGEVTIDDVRAHLAELSDDRLLAQLGERAAASEGATTVRVVEAVIGTPVPSPRRPARVLSCRQLPAPIESWWRTASFSQLSAAERAADPAEGRDRDERAPVAPEVEPADPLAAMPITLAAFPRGATAGNFFHEVLEHHDFTRAAPGRPEADDGLEPLVKERLATYGFPAQTAPVVRAALREVLATPLLEERSFRLCDVPATRRLDELEFYFPVANAMEVEASAVPRGTQLALGLGAVEPRRVAIGALTARKLGAAFREHPSPALASGYAGDVERLSFLPLRGFLKGYIDAVVEHEGRWYVIDYKTNHLGDTLAAYRPASLRAAMAHGHYYLQYHLYVIAVHRYLSLRLPGYDYDRDFGGALYLFLKGMTPRTGAASGVFFEKPPLRRIAALSELFDRPPA